MSRDLAADLTACQGMGTVIFTHTDGPVGQAIRRVEGKACNHTACVYYDTVRLEWRVAEMAWPRLRHMTLEAWLIANRPDIVGAFQLKANCAQLLRFNEYVLLKAYEQPRYALVDLLGFLAPVWRRLNSRWSLICSELAERASDYCGYRICPVQPIETVSPQDQMAQEGKTLSCNIWRL